MLTILAVLDYYNDKAFLVCVNVRMSVRCQPAFSLDLPCKYKQKKQVVDAFCIEPTDKVPSHYSLLQTRHAHWITECLQSCDQTGANTMSFLNKSQTKSLIWRSAMCAIKGLLDWIFMNGEHGFHLTLIFVGFETDSTLLASCVHSEQDCWTVIDTGCSGINMNDSVQTSTVLPQREEQQQWWTQC